MQDSEQRKAHLPLPHLGHLVCGVHPCAVVCDWLEMLLSTMLWAAGKARDRFSEPAICSANSFSFTRAGNNSMLHANPVVIAKGNNNVAVV